MGWRWQVGDLAKQTGLSVGALHHYDGLGLLKPPSALKRHAGLALPPSIHLTIRPSRSDQVSRTIKTTTAMMRAMMAIVRVFMGVSRG